MTVSPGARLGFYEITDTLGAGGMGEVFRARDTKLNRDVAIKVLPAAFADDPERLARFTREAQTLASLNHPNIAAIYGIEEIASSASSGDLVAMTGGVAPAGHLAMTKGVGTGASRALVMELVEGEDLSVHIARGPIPMAEALPIARQIAEALEAAHEQGIVHRDLKPANIKVRTDGTVKVLDFGLAKAMDGGGAANSALSHSPTMSRHMTEAGMIIGTAAYMSPEQAKGKAVDKRTDVWAFGVVLYEMLSGQRAFKGEDVSETLASVLKDKLSMNVLPAETPARLKRLIERCLDRDLKTRLRDIGEARVKLGRIEAGETDSETSVPTTEAAAVLPAWRRTLPWTLLAATLVAFIGSIVAWAPWRHAPGPTPRTLLALIGADASVPTNAGASAILSPDGASLAFVAQQAGKTGLFIRKLDQLQATALSSTEGAMSPFFSPDGQWIAFFASGKLKKVSVTGGAALTLCDAPIARGGTWAEERDSLASGHETIIFTPMSGADGVNTRLMRVSSSGGTPSPFVALSPGAMTQRWPQVLPSGRGVLYTENSSGSNFDEANLVIAPLPGRTSKVVVRNGYYGRYLPSGHLIYMQRGTVFATRLDLDRLETVGQAVPALEGVASSPEQTAGAQLAFSSDGTLVYVPGQARESTYPIHWMTRDGKTSVLRAEKADWAEPRFSPDGRKLALTIYDGKQDDIWVYEFARDTLTQLTFEPSDDNTPVWTPDGRRIAFSSDRAKAGVANLYWVNADGTGEVTRLTDGSQSQNGTSWHPSGRFLALSADGKATNWDLMILPLEGDPARGLTPGQPTSFLSTEAREASPMFSPDGRWIAYVSSEAGSGSSEVYVRPFPGPGGKWRISTGGGAFPMWSAAAHELLFVSQNRVMAAPYAVVGDSFRADAPKLWSPTGLRLTAGSVYRYDLHPDGKRLAIAPLPVESGGVQDKVVFFFGFGDYLKKIAPVTK